MNKTRIEWCDYTWNPVTGCLHGCEYCYARRLTDRFDPKNETFDCTQPEAAILRFRRYKRGNPWKHGFNPTFHEYRLPEPCRIKKPSRVFVVSMGDLFGEWVPDEWIEHVFKACEAAPWHTYYFLTKNPVRYINLHSKYDLIRTKHWYGASITGHYSEEYWGHPLHLGHAKGNGFLSLEPIMRPVTLGETACPPPNWLIVGAESGNRKGKIIPKKEWILDIREQCRDLKIPLFEKNSLAALDLPGGLTQEWPKEAEDERP